MRKIFVTFFVTKHPRCSDLITKQRYLNNQFIREKKKNISINQKKFCKILFIFDVDDDNYETAY